MGNAPQASSFSKAPVFDYKKKSYLSLSIVVYQILYPFILTILRPLRTETYNIIKFLLKCVNRAFAYNNLV